MFQITCYWVSSRPFEFNLDVLDSKSPWETLYGLFKDASFLDGFSVESEQPTSFAIFFRQVWTDKFVSIDRHNKSFLYWRNKKIAARSSGLDLCSREKSIVH